MNETMAGLIVLCFSVLLVYLLWRVWRLEDAAKQAIQNQRDGDDYLETRIKNVDRMTAEGLRHVESTVLARFQTYQVNVDRIGKNVDALARVLGYEWKRTEAKEGWEKKPVAPLGFGFGDLTAYRKALEHAINAPPIWAAPREYDWTLSTTNRRKGDRRKPTIAKAADDPFPSPLDRVVTRKKKPKRATH